MRTQTRLDYLSIAVQGARSMARPTDQEPQTQSERIAFARAAVGRALDCPTMSPALNILSRCVARTDAYLEELARAAQAQGRDGYARQVLANADATYVAMQFAIAAHQGRQRLVCSECAGWLNGPSDCVVYRTDGGGKELAHADFAECAGLCAARTA